MGYSTKLCKKNSLESLMFSASFYSKLNLAFFTAVLAFLDAHTSRMVSILVFSKYPVLAFNIF